MRYELECSSCGNVFELDVDQNIMDEYMLRLDGVWNNCSDGKRRKCWRPVNVVLKSLDDRTRMMLESAVCEKCLNEMYA